MKISREGNMIIPVLLLVLCALAAGFMLLTFRVLPDAVASEWLWLIIAVWGTGALVTWGFVIAFFRIPTRRPILADEGTVFSPCDGTVVVFEDVIEGEVTGEKRVQVSMFMAMTNVHMNWFPVSGRIVYFKHHPGTHFVAWHPKSSDKNEHATTAILTPGGETVVFRQVAGMVARRIVYYSAEGETAVQNTPCGFIKFGSRVDLLLPPDAEVLVMLGQKVHGSQTPIARFVRK